VTIRKTNHLPGSKRHTIYSVSILQGYASR